MSIDSPILARGRMAASLPRLLLVGRRRPSSAIARAVATTVSGRIPPRERSWIGAVESWREELASRQDPTRAGFAPQPGGLAPWATALDHTMPVYVAAAFYSIPALWGRFLMRLVSELAPRSCIELGTGLGISAAYQGAALELGGGGSLITLDAAESWGEIARMGFSTLGLSSRIEPRLGDIGDTLEEVLKDAAPVDYAYVDAEHLEAPTLAHFEAMLPHLRDGAVVVFDDIGLSAEMRRAWREIKRHPRVSIAIGLGRMGVVGVAA